MTDQFRKSTRGSWAYWLVSKRSTTANLPTVKGEVSGRMRTSQDVRRRFGDGLWRVGVERDHLPDEGARQTKIGNVSAELVRLPAGEARRTDGVAETEPLVDLGIEPELGAGPEPSAGIERQVERLLGGFRGQQAVGAAVRRIERTVALRDQGELPMDGPVLGGGAHGICGGRGAASSRGRWIDPGGAGWTMRTEGTSCQRAGDPCTRPHRRSVAMADGARPRPARETPRPHRSDPGTGICRQGRFRIG